MSLNFENYKISLYIKKIFNQKIKYNKKNTFIILKIKLLIFLFILCIIFFYNKNNLNIKQDVLNLSSHNIKTKANIINEKASIKKSFFFLEKAEKLKKCKNYGILIYNYPIDKSISPYGNIGDYIQSLAALQFLPKNCIPIFIDRDDIENYNGPKVTIIMNAWYRISKGNRFISSNLSPIYTSIHISNLHGIDSTVINNLKKYQPIGCRDIFTLKELKKRGINAYFSGCLTTTMDIDYSINESERTNDIIFIDYNFGYNFKIDNYIKSLKSYDFSNVIHTNHMFRKNLSEFEKFKLAKSLIDKYARAKLIITTRIHGALPCLALNTPFIFVNKRFDRRYLGIYELFNTVGINSTGQFNINVMLNKENIVVNPKAYLKYANKLKEILRNL